MDQSVTTFLLDSGQGKADNNYFSLPSRFRIVALYILNYSQRPFLVISLNSLGNKLVFYATATALSGLLHIKQVS